MLYHDRLETIENSQSTNSAKRLKIFNVYSSLRLEKIMSQFFNDHEIQNRGTRMGRSGGGGGRMEPLPGVFDVLQYFETLLPLVESL